MKQVTNATDAFHSLLWFRRRNIYRESDGLPLDAFFGVLLLLKLENVFVEVELQILVGVIDAQLLKTVFL